MTIKQITEITIYDTDVSREIYSRTNGSPMTQLHATLSQIFGSDMPSPLSPEYELLSQEYKLEIARVTKQNTWMEILKMSERSPALQEAVDRAIIIYELSKTDDEPLMWHPV